MPRLTDRERNIERRKKKKAKEAVSNTPQEQKPKATNPKQAPANRQANAARSQRQTHKVFDRGETTERKQTYNNRANQQSHKQYQYATPRKNPPSGRGGTRGHESYEAREPRAQNGSRILANTGRAIEKGLKDRVSGWAITAQDKTEEIAEKSKENPNVRGLQTQARRLGRDFDADSKVKELQEKHKIAEEEAEQSRKELQAKRDERQRKFEEQTKDASGFEKALYGAAESGAGMLADLAVGAAVGAATGGAGTVGTLASLGVGSYGQTRGTAEAQGATEDEDRMNALLQAGKEVATESIFRGVGLASGYAGRGSISLADRAANKLTSKLTGKAADLVGAGVRLGGGVAEENAEEAIGWLADPLISEATYEGNVRKRRQEQIRSQMKEESDALRAQVNDEQTARSIATYLSSDDFIERNKQEYLAAGLPEKRATAMAEQMRDYLTASLSGDTEEMERLEKEMATSITGKGLSTKSWSFKELGETIASTTLLTASTGLPGTIQSSVKGAQVKEQLGEDGIKAIAKTAIDFEDKEMSEKAQVMSDRLAEGKGITDTQAYDLMQGMMKQQEKDAKRMDASRNSAQQRIEDEELVSPYEEYEDGSLSLGPVTGQAIRANTKSAKSVIQSVNKENKDNTKYHISAKEVNEGASAIAAFQSGIMTIDDANAFNYNNQVVRKAFEETTGIDLDQYIVKKKNGSIDIPATNTKTKDALFVLASDNLVSSAQAETAEWMDNTKGEVVTNISARMGANGTVALQEALDDVDERNQSDYMLVANASDLLYQTARNMGAEWDSVKSDVTKMFPEIAESKLESMYLAGLNDRLAAEDTVRNRAVKIGKSMSEMGDQETATGQLFVDSKLPLKGTEIRLFSELANNLGADIHLVDHIKTNAGEANGAFNPKTNTFYINVANGAESNLGYIMMHEMTHYLKVNAPEQFLALENLVREKWFGYSPEQMQSEIARKVSLYKGEQALTEEMALEEIIADAAHEFINDPNFAKQVAEEDPTLAKALIDSIKKILRMLRRLFTVEGIERDDTHMNSLFSQLDILTEAEALWLDAYKTAVRNRGNQAIEELQDEIDGNIASEMEDRFSIVEDPELIKQLEADSHMKTYRAMAQINGKLYPPMATQIRDENGGWKLNDGIELGQWVESDITTDPKMFNAKGKFILKKDNGKTVPAAYNPYIHSSDSMLNDQFSTAYKRPNVVVVEGEIPESELTSGYRAEHDLDDGRHVIAKDSTGSAKWKAGIVEKDLPKDRQRTVYLTNHFKPTRIVPDREVAEHIRDKVAGTDIAIPYNVVTPGVRSELLDLGVKMEQSNEEKYQVRFSISDADYMDAVNRGNMDAAQRMVDEAAIKAGYNIETFHGTHSKFNKFKQNSHFGTQIYQALDRLGFYNDIIDEYEEDPEVSELLDRVKESGASVMRLYIKANNPLETSDLGDWGRDYLVRYLPEYLPNANIDWSSLKSVNDVVSALKAEGYDSIVYENLREGRDEDEGDNDAYILFDPHQAKLADPVTYDDNGDVIPLSERFNTEEPDIRYSIVNVDVNKLDKTDALVEDENGDLVAQFSKDGSLRLSVSSYEQKGRKIYQDYLKKMVKSGELSQDEADEMRDEFENIFRISKEFADTGKFAPFTAWSYADVIYDEKGKPVFSSVKKNSEYKMNIDFSTICKKRRTLDAVFREMVKRGMFEKLDLNKDESAAMVVNINDLIRQHNFEAACALCFVEARRYRQQQTATAFRDMWNSLVESMYSDKSKIAYFNFGQDESISDVDDGIHTMNNADLDLTYVKKIANERKEDGKLMQTAEAKAARLILKDPSQRKLMRVGDMMASTGFENMQIQNPKLMNIYNSKKGTGGAKSSFGDVQYLNEIIRSKTFNRRSAYAVSGVRIQSFSDYVARMVFDYVQVIADLAAKKLPAHAYTKEVLFAYQFGLTGTKINMSLVPDVVEGSETPGLDAEGDYVWNEDGTFPYDKAIELQNAEGYKENCGTIAVGISDAQIRKMLADPNIQMVIPYHKSSLNPIVAAMTNVDRFEDYTDYQNTKDENGKTVSKDFDWDNKLFDLSHDKDGNRLPKEKWGNVQDLVKEYVDWCNKRNYTPKFPQFLYMEDGSINPGYYKLLEDFALLDSDGNFKPQDDVKMRFPTESDAFGSMASLIEQGLTEDTELEEKRSAEVNGIVDEIEKMYENGTLAVQSDASEGLTVRFSIAEKYDEDYMSAVESGNMDEAQRLVDEAAKAAGMRPMHMYHGTMNAGFTVFDKSYAKVGGNSGAGFYFSTNMDDSADHYQDVEGADNYFKWSELAERILDEGEWNGEIVDDPDRATEIAKDYYNKNPGTFDVYLNYKTPYVRDYSKSTNLYDKIMEDYDESVIDRDDYDDEDDYYYALDEYRGEIVYNAIDRAVHDAYHDIENFYEVVEAPDISRVVNFLADYALTYESLTWEDVENSPLEMGLFRDDWIESGYGSTEFTRAIIENFGFDAIEDKEVSTKFGQLSREMQTDTEHVIVFKPEQIKLSDPVTYAEDGSVIPLSERFDPNNNDIRYSMPTEDSDGRVLTDGQMEYFKNSQARDTEGRLATVYHTTHKGGFTVFNPKRSDDKRSLFFASNFDVSQTYGRGGDKRYAENIEPTHAPHYESFDEFAVDLRDMLSKKRMWVYEEMSSRVRFQVRRRSDNEIAYELGKRAEDRMQAWLNMKGDPDQADDYRVSMDAWWSPDENKRRRIKVDTYDELMDVLSDKMTYNESETPFGSISGYYECYLNLENPLIVEGHGANWSRIPYGTDPIREKTLQRMKSEARLIVDQIYIEWVDYDWSFAGGNNRGLEITVFGEDNLDNGELKPWSAYKKFTIDEDKFAASGEEDPSAVLTMELSNYFTEDLGFSYEYFEEIANLVDQNGNVNYVAKNHNEEESSDYINSDGYKIDYAEIYDEIAEETDPDGFHAHYGPAYVTTRELAKIAENDGYDGVIIRDIVDISNVNPFRGENTLSDIYIAFSGEQVKDTRNENPTDNPDIRFSITPEDDALEWLASQYELEDIPSEDEVEEEGRVRMMKSKENFVQGKINEWNPRWLTEGKVLKESSVKGNIKQLVMSVMENSDTDRQYKTELVDKLVIDARSAYWMMKDGREGEAAELLWQSARDMIEDVDFIDDSAFQTYKKLRDYLKDTQFKLGEEYWQDVDYRDFRRRNLNRIKLVKGDTNIDSLYKELQEQWPEWFDENEQLSVPDQLLHIEEVLNGIQPYKYAYTSEEAAGLATDIADDLYSIVYEGKEYKSVADTYKERYDKKTKALKARHEEALRKVKEKGDLRVRREKAKFQAYKEKKKNAKEKAKHFGSIQKNLDWLTTRLVNETKDKNIPEPFRRSLAHLLMQFDMQTERSKKLEEKYGVSNKQLKIRELKRRLEDISKEDGTGEFEYSGYLFYLMDALAEKVEGESIDALDTEDLIAVDTLLKSLRHNFSNYDKVWKEGKQVEIAELGDNTIKTMQTHIDKYGQRKSHTGVIGLTDKLLNEGEETPVYLFGRIDPEGTGIGAMYKEMRRGEDKHIRNMDFLRKRFADMFGEYFNKKKPGSELENWRNSAQEQTFNLENGSITLNPAQIMSLYCLSKRPQALGHILGSGIVASPVNTQQKLREAVKGRAEQVESVRVTYDEVQTIISSLTPEQIKLADEMQSLMNNEMAAWGNEASLRLHGIKLFREKNYFPIKSSGEALDKTADSFDNAEKIKNFGFTKPLERNANNAIMLDDIFSVVADHCNKMSLYNSMAVPITDFMRVYNYKQRREDGTVESTVQAKIGEAYTRKVNQYIMKFISDVNGSTQTRSDAVDDLMNKALANYKKASIGFNMRVALQQPTAIFRAFMVISPTYFTKVPSPSAIKEMQEHCPIALWKSWGHYDMDLGRDIEDVMMNNDWSKFDVATMGLYGALDNATWSMIWQACKNEVEDKHPDVEVGSEEYWELCNERASEVFDKTQVVDSIFHRSDVMRSKNTLTKMAVSFMAEPTLTYNCLRNSMVNAYEMWKDGNKREALSQVEKTLVVLALNAAAVSASAAIWDAIRGKGADGDDDKDFAQLWFMNFFENLKDNANMLNNIYFVSNIMDIAQGWGTQNMALEGFATFFKGLEQAKKKYQGAYQAWQEPTWYDVYMNIFGGVGYVTGVPVKTAMRDARALMNKLGLEVFADDGSIKGEEEINSWLDTLRESLPGIPEIKLPSLPFGKKDEEEEELPLTPKEYRATLEDGLTESQKNEYIRQYRQYLKSIGWDDESLEKAKEKAGEKTSKTDTKSKDKEEEKDPYQVMDERAAKKSEGLSGEELDDALWSSIGEGYTKHLQDADFAHINKIRSIYEKYGGDVEKFDKKILEQCPTAYKKTFVDDMTEEDIHKQELLKDYMLEHGVTMEQLSDICYRTYAARDLKAALRMGNEQYILDELVPLVRAGLSMDDFYKLYKYRNYGADSYDGKYSGDEYKASTGTYVWPTQGQITSYFGYRNAPTAGASSNHPAIDIGASQGSPVVAADGGTVISAGSAGGYGNQVAIRHDNGVVTYYSHLYGWNVKVGDQVAQGQQIGQVGSTGVSTGPHLDFKVEVNGEPVNPLDYLKS